MTMNSSVTRPAKAISARELLRRARRAVYDAAAANWRGTREGLRRAVRAFLKPHQRRWGFLVRILREARFASLIAGAVLGVGAGAASASPPIELSTIAAGTGGFVINGIDMDDWSGRSVSSVGDVNGDSIDDLIVGARLADPGGDSAAGESYVVFGKTSGTAVDLSAVVAGTGGFVINGIDVNDFSGTSVASAGDVNGDGLADLIVGAYYGDPGGDSAAGESYVVFGKTSGTAVDLSAVAGGTGGFVINGIDASDWSGRSVSAAGDVNGDGLSDLIVGAWLADPSGNSAAGESYVVFGKTGGTAVELSAVAAGTGGFVINGIDPDDRAGQSVASAGDVNGDGLADLIVGAYKADPGGDSNAGESYVVFGKTDGAAVELSTVVAGTGGFVINGIDAGDYSGNSVDSAGDVNGDGLADLIIGAYFADPGGNSSAGKSYVVFGKTSGTVVDLSTVAVGTGGFVINGIDADDDSGQSVASAGDVNGDGLADLIVGAWRADPGGDSLAGESYVVLGKTDGTAVELSAVAAGAGGFVLNGIDPNDRAGRSVSSAGDVNGDGLADLIVGAFAGDPGGDSDAGESYVIFSLETPPSTPPTGVPASGTYLAKTIIGDGAGGAIVPVTSIPDARVKGDFSDNDLGDNGSGGASLETVTLTRNDSSIGALNPLSDVANVMWSLTTDRVNWASALLTFKYLDSEIAGITGGETNLRVFIAASPAGPWTQLATTIDAARNTAAATIVSGGGPTAYFALAAAGTVPVELSEFSIE